MWLSDIPQVLELGQLGRARGQQHDAAAAHFFAHTQRHGGGGGGFGNASGLVHALQAAAGGSGAQVQLTSCSRIAEVDSVVADVRAASRAWGLRRGFATRHMPTEAELPAVQRCGCTCKP